MESEKTKTFKSLISAKRFSSVFLKDNQIIQEMSLNSSGTIVPYL